MRWNRDNSPTTAPRSLSPSGVVPDGRTACAMLREGTLGAHLLRLASEAATASTAAPPARPDEHASAEVQ